MEEYLGVIKMFAGNFAPVGYQFCQGQLLSIAQNTALYSLLGTTYGGNGQTTFALPDLRARAPFGTGQGSPFSNIELGAMRGSQSMTLTLSNMPAHTHAVTGTVQIPVNDSNADADGPVGSFLGAPAESIYSSSSNALGSKANVNLVAAPAGGNLPFSILPPTLGMNYIICTQGIYPSRP